MAEAQEEVNAAQGALLPQVSLGATAGRQKYGASLFGPLDITIPPFTYYTVGPTVSVPLDLFGGERRTRGAGRVRRLPEARAGRRLSVADGECRRASAGCRRGARPDRGRTGIIADDQRNAALVQTALDDGSATRTQLLAAQPAGRRPHPAARSAPGRERGPSCAGDPGRQGAGGMESPRLRADGFRTARARSRPACRRSSSTADPTSSPPRRNCTGPAPPSASRPPISIRKSLSAAA